MHSMFENSEEVPDWVAKMLVAPLPPKPAACVAKQGSGEAKEAMEVSKAAVMAIRSNL